jgi:hypothetical protein
LTHGLDNIGRSAVALSAPALGQAQLAVGATYPVDDENDLGRRVVYIGHDLMDEGAHNALLEAGIRRRRIPDCFEVRGQNAKRSWIDHAAHLDELLPIPAVASEARDLTGANRTNLTEANFPYHPLEAGALYPAGGRTAEIIINHFDLRPPERRQPVPHGVLQRATLTIMQHLMC